MPSRLISIALLLFPAALAAQSTHQRPIALLLGVGLEAGEDDYGPGVQVGARFMAYTRASFDLRIDATYQSFGQGGTHLVSQQTTPCPGPCPTATGDRMKILSLNASAAWHAAGWPGLVAGVGMYGALETPQDGRYARPGWSLGFTSSTSRRAFFEMRYHGIAGAQVTEGFTILTVGIRL